MKIKKNKIKLFVLIFLLLFVIILSVGLYFLAKYNLNISDGKLFVKNNFSLNPATNEEILDYNTESQHSVDILHYEIHINLYPNEEKISSNVKITGAVKVDRVKEIELNFFDGFSISELKLDGKDVKYNYEEDKLKIEPELGISDTFNIQVIFEGTPENLGFGSFNFGTNNEKSVIYTLNEPIFASTWFPCNDLPTDKVLTDIYITNDSSMVSISNGILIEIIPEQERLTYHWKTSYPISTYLISLYSSDYSKFSDYYITQNADTMNIDYYVFSEDLAKARKDFSIHPKAIKIFSEIFGEYPFVKEKYGVAEFLWNFGAMEHQTITGIGKNFVSGNQFFTGMLVHELAHQWWGNAVTLSSWKDIWLNEGFATYSEALYWEKENGPSALKSTMRSFNTNFDGTTLYNPKSLFSRVVYNKGAWVLHMLRSEIGDSIFFKLLGNYYEQFKYQNASTKDFIKLAESTSGKDLKQFFNQWVFKGKGKIEVEYKFNYSHKKSDKYLNELVIMQKQEGYDVYKFPLEVEFLDGVNTKTKNSYIIDKKITNIKFYSDKKIVLVNLDPESRLALESHHLITN